MQILVVVRIYRPLKASQGERSSTFPNSIKYAQEIHLLGSNKLSELRDYIKCAADETRLGEISEDPTAISSCEKAKYHYPSGFFYINGCFYNDMRWEGCIDYSATIREWASKKKHGMGPFTTAKMGDTLLRDLTVRLGYPYVYVHQGEHEHLFSFIDVRLLSVDDPQRPSDYPLERSAGAQHSKMCMVCNSNVARWVTKDNARTPDDPFFFCSECFYGFNYTAEGQKIGSFKAYEYVDTNAM